MIKQEFPNNSPPNEVYQIATAMIRAQFNSMPSSNTMLTFLEEERDAIEPEMSTHLDNIVRSKLLRKESEEE